MSTLFTHWGAWISTIACALTAFSCFLLLLDLPGQGHWIEKSAICAVLLGSAGVSVEPLAGEGLFPSFAEVLLRVGVAVFSVWLTSPHWHQLPLLNRRCREDGHKTDRTRQGEAVEFFEVKS